MIFPDKHIRVSESLLGFGSFILSKLQNPCNLETLWGAYKSARENGDYPSIQSYENFILTIDFLFAIGMISYSEDSGEFALCV